MPLAPDASRSVTPREEVHRDGSLRLHRYRGSSAAARGGAPVVLIYSMINRPTVLDLMPERSVVASLLAAGHDVFLADWGEPGRGEAGLDLGGHLGRLARAVRCAAGLAGTRDASLLGYCLGGTMALALAALEPALVRSIGLLATPVVFEHGGLLGIWARASGIDPALLAVGANGNVPGTMLRELLRWQDPVGAVKKWLTLAGRFLDRGFVEPFLAQEGWANDCVDFPRALFGELITGLYREDRLARGTLVAGGRPVRLDALRLPILNVISEGDRIVPAESSLPLADLVGSEGRVETLRVGGGHIGMTVGRRAASTTHTALAAFFERNRRSA